jgi:iron complex outermembrane receptor protein
MFTLKKLKLKLLFISIVLSLSLGADEIDIDNLLSDIEKKTDLSEKTKLQNSGVSTIYTRNDLIRMQARNLKDIIKSTYPIGYTENIYGIPDPQTMGTVHPFMSSNVRIFIDNQEISTGMFGSGLVIYGDMNIDFVDHIEIYNGSPTYEFSTEPTYTLIKLYSKKASKDGGSKVTLSAGNFGDSFFSAYHAEELDNDWSYFAYISQNNDKRQKYESHGSDLSRDKTRTHIFASFGKEDHKILIDAISQDRDTFMDQSLDATPTNAQMQYDSLHIGYDGKYNDFSYLLSYDFLKTKGDFSDNVSPLPPSYLLPVASLESASQSYVLNGEIKHKYKTESNNLVTGLKYRYKGFKYSKILRNGFDLPTTGHTKQTIATAFIENKYAITDNAIFSTGLSYSQVKNNNSVQNDDLIMYRLGYTHTTEHWIFKTICSRMETSLDPYLVNGYGIYITEGKKDTTEHSTFMQNIIYEKGKHKYELIFGKVTSRNQLIADPITGLLDNYSQDIITLNTLLNWTFTYNKFDTLYLNVGYTKSRNLPIINKNKEYISTLRNLNTYGKFDIFNEIFYFKSESDNINYYDYSAGIIYHHTDDLSISLKGTNILDKAPKTLYSRRDPITFQAQTPLAISAIDRHIMLTLEYSF